MRPADNHVSSVSSRSPEISGLVLLLFMFLLLALLCSVQCVASARVALCPADEEAMAAMRAVDNVSVSYTRGIGYSFVNTANSVTIPFTPGIPYSFVNTAGNNITLGMVILPELGVAPEAYAVYARLNFWMGDRDSALWLLCSNCGECNSRACGLCHDAIAACGVLDSFGTWQQWWGSGSKIGCYSTT